MPEKMTDKVVRCSRDTTHIRNIAIVAHIDHGKTTLSDNLLAGAGMISKELAGKVLQLDFKRDEQERGITIDTAAASMVQDVDGEEYLINLLDTPGHVDFGGDLTRVMRAVDGCVVLVDAVEGVMPQTETVLRQALCERVKPVLFINKVDRLITQQQHTPAQIHERFLSIIAAVNQLIARYAEQPYADAWQVRLQDGTVVFGSALHQWALSLSAMQKTGIGIKNIIDAYAADTVRTLAEKFPLHHAVLSLIVRHLPDPAAAQQCRIPKIWHGTLSSSQGQALLACDARGPVSFVATKITVDPHQATIAAGRLFSGTIRRGDELSVCGAKKKVKVSQLYIYNGAKRDIIEEACAGNIIGIAGLKIVAGDTLVSIPSGEPFERLAHLFEPVVTVSVEPLHASDLPRLAEVLEQVQTEDPGIKVAINPETGESLISGLGELHLEIVVNRIRTEKNVAITTSPPLVVYRESILKTGSAQGISPNKQNTFSFTAVPLPPGVVSLFKTALPSGRFSPAYEMRSQLVAAGLDRSRSASIRAVYHGTLFADISATQLPSEAREMVLDVFEEVMRGGPLACESCSALLVTLTGYALQDARILDRAQIYPAVRDGIRGALLSGVPYLLEPKQVLRLEAPEEYAGELTKLIAHQRGQLIEMNIAHSVVVVTAKMPVADLFGFTALLRSVTGGRGTSAVIDQVFEKVPDDQQQKLLAQVRKRKGMYQ